MDPYIDRALVLATEAEDLQRRYRKQRLRWMRNIGMPVSAEWDEPDPGELDTADPENG